MYALTKVGKNRFTICLYFFRCYK